MNNFTPRQVADWRAFEKVRLRGTLSMFDRRARETAGLRREECLFVMQHYAGLKAAAGEIPAGLK